MGMITDALNQVLAVHQTPASWMAVSGDETATLRAQVAELSAQVSRRDDIIRNLMRMDAERDARIRQLESEALALVLGKDADAKTASFPPRALRAGQQTRGWTRSGTLA